jgi:hypothetical protein
MNWDITPEPTEEERAAIEAALAEEPQGLPSANARPEELWSAPGVVEPGDPRQRDRDE